MYITLRCQFHEALLDGVSTSLILILNNGRFMFLGVDHVPVGI